MAIESYFFNAVQNGNTYDREYTAEDFCNYLELLVGNGVFANPSTNLQVRADTGMQVIVGAGQGWINGHKLINTDDLIVDIAASDVVLNRIDRVIFYVDHTTRTMGIEVKTGTAAASPTAPGIVQNDARFELCLATVYVGKQVTSIINSNITDTREDANVCGYVAGLIDQIDGSTLFQQYDDQFTRWFREVRNDLVTATLIRKYAYTYTTTAANESTFNVKALIPEYAFGLDILEIRINGLALTTAEFTKNENNVTLATPVINPGTPIEFVIYKSVDGSDAESVVDLVYKLQTELEATRITNTTGGVQLILSDSSSDLLASYVNLGIGFHTVYADGSVKNVPESRSVRCFGHMTGVGIGYIFAIDYNGSVFTNYCSSGTWKGWRCIYSANPTLLWSGGAWPNNGYTVTPSKKLSECRNGWLLTFSGFNTSTQASTDTLVQSVCIPKVSYNGNAWGGAVMVMPLLYSLNSETGAVSQTAKAFNVYDDKLVSTAYNVATASKNLVLRSVQEY